MTFPYPPDLGEPTLGKLHQETDFSMTKHMPKPSSGLVTKNGEHFYGENFIHDFPKSWKHIKEVDWGGKLKLNYTTYGYMLMEIDWGGKFNYTSCGYPILGVASASKSDCQRLSRVSLLSGIERKQSKLPFESPTMVRFQEDNGCSQLKFGL